MKTNETMNPVSNLLINCFILFCSVAVLCVFLFLLFFRGLAHDLRLILIGISVAVLAAAVISKDRMDEDKNTVSRTVLFLLEVPVLIVYRQLYPIPCMVSLAGAAILAADLFIRNCYTSEGWKSPREFVSALPTTFDHCIRTASAVCFPVFLMIVMLNLRGTLPAELLPLRLDPPSPDGVMFYDPMYIHRDNLNLLDESVWRVLSREKKIDILRDVMDVELTEMGIPYDITLTTYPMDNLGGYYRPLSHMITLNSDIVDGQSAESCLETLLHELRHVYQDGLAHLYANSGDLQGLDLLEEAKACYENYRNYHDYAIGSFDSYYDQYLETDARNYGLSELDVYRPFFAPQ